MKISNFKAKKFTAFENVNIEFSNGVNILLGENATGKTHVMKALYAICTACGTQSNYTMEQKIMNVFMPDTIGRLVTRKVGGAKGIFETTIQPNDNSTETKRIRCEITTKNSFSCTPKNYSGLHDSSVTFIPVKDMLANAPGFRALYANKKLCFEEIYADIIDKAFLPVSKGKHSKETNRLMNSLSDAMSGRVVTKNETFYLKQGTGKLEFTLLAEGHRKLGLLYTLINNETLANGSVLFWDEPEANLNPTLSKAVVKLLLDLHRMGVQIFISTHDYFILKQFEMEARPDDRVMYHLFSRMDESSLVSCRSTSNPQDIYPNAIDTAINEILDEEIAKDFQDDIDS